MHYHFLISVDTGLSTTMIVVISIAVAFVILIAVIVLYCKVIIKWGRPDYSETPVAPSSPTLPTAPPNPSAPPLYNEINQTPEDMPPSYDEAVTFRRLSQYFTRKGN